MEWSDILESIMENKSWIFSGIGVAIIGGVIAITKWFFSGKGNSTSQISKVVINATAGDNSEQNQTTVGDVTGNVNIDNRKGMIAEEIEKLFIDKLMAAH